MTEEMAVEQQNSYWSRNLREKDPFWETFLPQGPTMSAWHPKLTRKLQRDLPHVVAVAKCLSEEMEGLCVWHEEDKRLTGLKQELGISFINPICLKWEQRRTGDRDFYFVHSFYFQECSYPVPPPSILEIHVHKHTDSLTTHTYTHKPHRMTAQLGCVQGAQAGVVWSVCMRVCGRICR